MNWSEDAIRKNQGWFQGAGFRDMKKENLLPLLHKQRRRKEMGKYSKPKSKPKFFKKSMRNVKWFNCHEHGHYARDCLERISSYKQRSSNNYNNRFPNRKRRYYGGRRYEGRSDARSDHDQEPHPQKRYKNTRYGNNVATSQSDYFLISTLFSASPLDSLDSWLEDSGASKNSMVIKKSPLIWSRGRLV